MSAALAVEDLDVSYEPGLPIVRGANLTVEAGEILAILGPNGAGKSSLAKAVVGLAPVTRGRTLLFGRDITRTPAHRMIFEGLAYVPQMDNVFSNLSITENLELAAAVVKANRKQSVDLIYGVFPDLQEKRTSLAGNLSGGQRQMLAMARGLIARPRLLILDEPSAGLSPKMIEQVFAKLREVRKGGVAILLVEQNVKAALALADRAAILVEGKERLVAPCSEFLNDPRVAELYLGSHARR
ncbi:MAG TPA: ABC transporter ATP-binding protein [Bryobacteraceae bacterium]|jgi:branched-chain amino acid transport system ATP-binding protein